MGDNDMAADEYRVLLQSATHYISILAKDLAEIGYSLCAYLILIL